MTNAVLGSIIPANEPGKTFKRTLLVVQNHSKLTQICTLGRR